MTQDVRTCSQRRMAACYEGLCHLKFTAFWHVTLCTVTGVNGVSC